MTETSSQEKELRQQQHELIVKIEQNFQKTSELSSKNQKSYTSLASIGQQINLAIPKYIASYLNLGFTARTWMEEIQRFLIEPENTKMLPLLFRSEQTVNQKLQIRLLCDLCLLDLAFADLIGLQNIQKMASDKNEFKIDEFDGFEQFTLKQELETFLKKLVQHKSKMLAQKRSQLTQDLTGKKGRFLFMSKILQKHQSQVDVLLSSQCPVTQDHTFNSIKSLHKHLFQTIYCQLSRHFNQLTDQENETNQKLSKVIFYTLFLMTFDKQNLKTQIKDNYVFFSQDQSVYDDYLPLDYLLSSVQNSSSKKLIEHCQRILNKYYKSRDM